VVCTAKTIDHTTQQFACIVGVELFERWLRFFDRFVLSFKGIEESLLDIFRSGVVEILVDAIHAVEGEGRSLTILAHRRDIVSENIENKKESLSAPTLSDNASRLNILAEPVLPQFRPRRRPLFFETISRAYQSFEAADICLGNSKLISFEAFVQFPRAFITQTSKLIDLSCCLLISKTLLRDLADLFEISKCIEKIEQARVSSSEAALSGSGFERSSSAIFFGF
jgi:hypothetical protein